MDHWVSLYIRIVSLLESLGEGEVALRPSSFGVLQNLVESFCRELYIASSSVRLSPYRATSSPKPISLGGREGPREQSSTRLSPIEEESEEDTLSIPDSLPDLVDSTEEEEGRLPSVLVEKGIIPPGVVLSQDRVRSNRFWLLG